MVSYQEIAKQLQKLGVNPHRLFRAEVEELQEVLHDDEQIKGFMSGRYQGDPAIVVATNERILLVDKKPLHISVQSIPYNVISKIKKKADALQSSMNIYTFSKSFRISTYRQSFLKPFVDFVETKLA